MEEVSFGRDFLLVDAVEVDAFEHALKLLCLFLPFLLEGVARLTGCRHLHHCLFDEVHGTARARGIRRQALTVLGR